MRKKQECCRNGSYKAQRQPERIGVKEASGLVFLGDYRGQAKRHGDGQ